MRSLSICKMQSAEMRRVNVRGAESVVRRVWSVLCGVKDSEFRLQKSECKCQTQSVDEKVTLTLSVKQSVDEKVTLTLSRRTECG